MQLEQQYSITLAKLRALYVVYQTCHWSVKGSNFYGNHLLFQRLYEDTQKLVDTFAEKCIGYFSASVVNIKNQSVLINNQIDNWSKSPNKNDYIFFALRAGNDVLISLDYSYSRIQEISSSKLGMDDTIMSIAAKIDEFQYLLKQSNG